MKFKSNYQKRKIYFIVNEKQHFSTKMIYSSWKGYCYEGYSILGEIVHTYDTNDDGHFLDCLNKNLKRKELKTIRTEAELVLAINIK